jgi:hypothetical protein
MIHMPTFDNRGVALSNRPILTNGDKRRAGCLFCEPLRDARCDKIGLDCCHNGAAGSIEDGIPLLDFADWFRRVHAWYEGPQIGK